jgi:hypothetical protein
MPGQTYRYRTHGLTLDSDIELPELVRADAAPDILVRTGRVADALDGPVVRGPGYQAARGEFLLDVPGVARYAVTGGNRVTVDPLPSAAPSDVRVYLFASAMAALLHQRGLFALHASAVEIDGRCVLFAGDSGTGKSTLTAAFHDRGCRVITDDIAIVSFDDAGRPVVHPGYRQLRLAADSLEHAGHTLGAPLGVRNGKQKLTFHVPGAPVPGPVRPVKMFLLTRRTRDTVHLRDLAGHQRVMGVVRATYRRRILAAVGRRADHFERCAALAHAIDISEVERPASLTLLGDLVDALERDVRAIAAAHV